MSHARRPKEQHKSASKVSIKSQQEHHKKAPNTATPIQNFNCKAAKPAQYINCKAAKNMGREQYWQAASTQGFPIPST
eukprot:586368-Pelagomonas_calceolata.AAC.5